MGKDKGNKLTGASEKEKAEALTKRPPKGHRQKGAGTVIVAPPPVVTGDGIILKPHERLPIQLLNEYCQKEKRSRPKYYPSEPNYRMKVILHDEKNSKNNLTFCPVQSFESESMAKNYAALLALHHFQKQIPLERKLPEPFSSTWLQLISTEKSKKLEETKKKTQDVKPTTKPETESTKIPTTVVTKQTVQVKDQKKIDIKPETLTPTASYQFIPDWLCDNCGSLNFGLLASGVERKKCFKCNQEKTGSSTTVANGNTNVKTSQKTVVGTSVSGSQKGGKFQKISAKEVRELQGDVPAPVLDLRSQSNFASKAEKEREKIQKKSKSKQRQRFFEALKRANRPTPVYLSPKLRHLIENALGLNTEKSDNLEINDEDESENFSDFLKDVSTSGVFPQDLCGGIGAERQSELLSDVVQVLVRQGFNSSDVSVALRETVTRSSEDILEDLSELDGNDDVTLAVMESAFVKKFVEAALEIVCLKSSTALPSRFDGQEFKPTGIQVYNSGAEKGPPVSEKMKNVEEVVSLEEVVGKLRDLERDVVIELFGFYSFLCTPEDCLFVVLSAQELIKQIIKSGSDVNDNDQKLELSVVSTILLLSAISLKFGNFDNENLEITLSAAWGLKQVYTGFKAENNGFMEIMREEIDSLEAIYGEVFSPKTIKSSILSTVELIKLEIDTSTIGLFEEIENNSITLHVTHFPILDYPNRPPLISFSFPNTQISELLGPDRISGLLSELNRKSQDLLGNVMVFELQSTILDYLSDNSADISFGSIERYFDLQESVSSVVTWVKGEGELESSMEKERDLKGSIGFNEEDSSKIENSGNSVRIENSIGISSKSTKNSFPEISKNFEKEKSSHPFWMKLSKPEKSVQFPLNSTETSNSPLMKTRRSLPAWTKRNDFLQLIQDNRAVVVTGETGCGKTTQIPQFLLENDRHCKIVVCQPRRLAAVGVAARVAEEAVTVVGDARGGKIGGVVGHMVKGDSKAGPDTRIVFCTYGVMLRRLQADALLEAIDYVILDEVHERGVDSDFTLTLLLSAMALRPQLKLIIMSATIATDRFAEYLGRGLKSPPAPILFIPGYTFPVVEFYKGDYERALRSDGEEPLGGPRRKGELDYDLLIRLILALANGRAPMLTEGLNPDMLRTPEGSILVFLPGVPDIQKGVNLLQQYYHRRSGNHLVLKVLALHGSLSPSEQRKVFQPVAAGELKIVLATNVAEASVTIPDVSVVIDTCKVKEMSFDPETLSPQLRTTMAAVDSLRQRRGRAGRVKAGRCFRMITIGTFEKLPAHSVPEMLRIPLEKVVLQVKAMDWSSFYPKNEKTDQNDKTDSAVVTMDVLRRCPDVPAEEAVDAAEQLLVQIQALDGGTGHLTPLGRHLAALPCDPRVGRLLLFGALLGCCFPASCVAACLSARSPFLSSGDPEVQQKVNSAKEKFSIGTVVKSDYMVLVNVMKIYINSTEQRRFCKENGLSYERMEEIRKSQKDLLQSLTDLGFLKSQEDGLTLPPRTQRTDDTSTTTTISSKSSRNNHLTDYTANRNAHKQRLVAATFCAGLYPQLARVMRPPKRFIEVVGGAVEKDNSAKEMKFYLSQIVLRNIPGEVSASDSIIEIQSLLNNNTGLNSDESAGTSVDISTQGLLRVFVHPSSLLFQEQHFRHSNFLLYGERQLVTYPPTKGNTQNSKLYLRDATEATAFGLLFFGGKLEPQYLNGTVTVDGWIRFSAPGRIVALVQALRKAFDDLLIEKIEDPTRDISRSKVLDATCKLLETDGAWQ